MEDGKRGAQLLTRAAHKSQENEAAGRKLVWSFIFLKVHSHPGHTRFLPHVTSMHTQQHRVPHPTHCLA